MLRGHIVPIRDSHGNVVNSYRTSTGRGRVALIVLAAICGSAVLVLCVVALAATPT